MQINWNTAAPRSIFDTTTKSTYLGTRNLKVAGMDQISPFSSDRAWSYVPNSPKALALASKPAPASAASIPKMILSPIEALEIKYALPHTLSLTQMTTYTLPGDSEVIWRGRKIVLERVLGTPGYLTYLLQTNNQLERTSFSIVNFYKQQTGRDGFAKFNDLLKNSAAKNWTQSALSGFNSQFFRQFMQYALNYADRIFEAQVEDAELVFTEAIRALQNVYLDSSKAPPAFKSRFKTNGVVLNPQHANTNATIFSLKPDTSTNVEDPEMDFLLNAYAKSVVDTRTKSPSLNIVWPQDSIATFRTNNLGEYYPTLNLSTDNLNLKVEAPKIGQLYMARVWCSKLSSQKVNLGGTQRVSCAIGTKNALLGMFLLASREEKLTIAKAIYNKKFGDNLAQPIRNRIHSSSVTTKIGSFSTRVDYRYLLGQILYLDSFNHTNLVRKVVAYLLWVQRKVELAKAQITQGALRLKDVNIQGSSNLFVPRLPSINTSQDAALVNLPSFPQPTQPSLQIRPQSIPLSPTSSTQDQVEDPELEVVDEDMIDFDIVEEPEFDVIDEDFVDVEVIPHSDPIVVDVNLELPSLDIDLEDSTIATETQEKDEKEDSDTKATSNTTLVVGSVVGVALLAGGVWWYQKNKR